jgi:1-acyl-sn-glycerol-3-phosphate acyltransferase
MQPGAAPPSALRAREGRSRGTHREASAGVNLDGFRLSSAQPFVGYSEAAADRFYGIVGALARRLHVEVEGIERIPPGRALLVANHAFGWDVVFAMSAIWHATRRPVWALGEHLWWKIPYLRRLAAAVGTVDGTGPNVDQLLSADQIVLVLPGGMREAVKPRELRYRLLWGHRYGFVRAAIRHRAPLLPLASIGADDLFDFKGDAYARGRRWLRRAGLPVPLPARILPIPHRTHLRYVIGEPIVARAEPSQADDAEVLRHTRCEVEGALCELIDCELARRSGIDLGNQVLERGMP